MERLTGRNEKDNTYYYPHCFEKCAGFGHSPKCDECDFSYEVCEKLGKYEDTGITPEQIREIDMLYAEKCRELEKIRKSLLPCAVGDTVYSAIYDSVVGEKYVEESGVEDVSVKGITFAGDFCAWEDFGKMDFLNREEAETALETIEEKRGSNEKF